MQKSASNEGNDLALRGFEKTVLPSLETGEPNCFQ